MSEENQTTPDQTTASEAGPSEQEIKTALKAKADLLGVKYSNNATIETLRNKIAEAQAEEEKAPEAAQPVETQFTSIRAKQRAEQMKLVRCRISNMNPDKADLSGEIVTVRTKYLGIVKRFVPFGEVTDNGWHIPQIILENLQNRKFLYKSAKQDRATGQINVKTRWVKEFAIEILPDLTKEELEDDIHRGAETDGALHVRYPVCADAANRAVAKHLQPALRPGAGHDPPR